MLSESESDFFLTSDDMFLITKALVHLAECDCIDVKELVEIFPLVAKIEELSFSELDHLSKSWEKPEVDE
jgi:uncharacterized protein YfkK (UPF0435 family)